MQTEEAHTNPTHIHKELTAVDGQINSQIIPPTLGFEDEKGKAHICNNGHCRRGRKAAKLPSARHLEILKATKSHTYEEVGQQYGFSKQRVAQIAKRWRDFLPIRPLAARKQSSNYFRPQARTPKEIRTEVISFRLTTAELQKLQQHVPNTKSPNQVARRIVLQVISI